MPLALPPAPPRTFVGDALPPASLLGERGGTRAVGRAMGPPPPQILASPLTGPGIPVLTSRISLILAPALPMSEPHWLAGMTRRSVTGALPAAAPSALPAPRSCGGDRGDRGGHTLMWALHPQAWRGWGASCWGRRGGGGCPPPPA